MKTFCGFQLRPITSAIVEVIDPRYNKLVVTKRSVKEAKAWIVAYLRGSHWAIEEAYVTRDDDDWYNRRRDARLERR